MLTLIDTDRQFFLAAHGFPSRWHRTARPALSIHSASTRWRPVGP
jgi:hypothetical protein